MIQIISRWIYFWLAPNFISSIILSLFVLAVITLFSKRLKASWKGILLAMVFLRLLIPGLVEIPQEYWQSPEGENPHFVLYLHDLEPSAVEGQDVLSQDRPIGQTLRSLSHSPLILKILSWKTQRREGIEKRAQFISESRWFVRIYCLGILVVLTIYSIQIYLRFRGCYRPNEEIQERLDRIARPILEKLHLKDNVRYYLSIEPGSPAAGGFFPSIFLPEVIYLECNDKELELILYHELLHLKKKDPFKLFFFSTLCLLYWYNPFIWILKSHWRQLVEEQRDWDLRHSLKERILEFGKLLVQLAIDQHKSLKTAFTHSFSESQGLKTRIERILSPVKGSKVLSLGLILLLFFGACSSIHIRPEEAVDLTEDNLNAYLNRLEEWKIKPSRDYTLEIVGDPVEESILYSFDLKDPSDYNDGKEELLELCSGEIFHFETPGAIIEEHGKPTEIQFLHYHQQPGFYLNLYYEDLSLLYSYSSYPSQVSEIRLNQQLVDTRVSGFLTIGLSIEYLQSLFPEIEMADPGRPVDYEAQGIYFSGYDSWKSGYLQMSDHGFRCYFYDGRIVAIYVIDRDDQMPLKEPKLYSPEAGNSSAI